MARTTPIGDFLLSGANASAQSGAVMDCRNAANYAYVRTHVGANSALVCLQVAPDATAWMTALQFTATTVGVTAQISAFYPYVRAFVVTKWGDATAHLHYTPGTIP